MNAVLWTFSEGLPNLLYSCILYRFLGRTLNRRYSSSVTFGAIALFTLVYSQANISLRIAGTVVGNSLYYCIGYFLFCLLLYQSHFIKTAFFVVLLQCSFAQLSHLYLPLLAVKSPFVQGLIPYIGLLLFDLLIEWPGRKFQNLRFEIPCELAAYLMFVTLFVFVTTSTITQLSMMTKEYASLPAGLFYNLFAICGTIIIALAVFTIDKQTANRLSEQSMTMQTTNAKTQGQVMSLRLRSNRTAAMKPKKKRLNSWRKNWLKTRKPN